MLPTVDVWWTLGDHAEPLRAAETARRLTAVPLEWRRGRRGRFLAEITRHCRAQSPQWSAKGASKGWRFNLSSGQHLSLTDAGRHLIIAVGQGVPIGIDAERHRPIDDAAGTLERLGFAPIVAKMGRLTPAARNRAFVHIWTAFEAFLKLERLPWDAAAAEFSRILEGWRFTTDGSATFDPPKSHPVAFHAVSTIPGVFLTVAAPSACRIATRAWNLCLPSQTPQKTSGDITG